MTSRWVSGRRVAWLAGVVAALPGPSFARTPDQPPFTTLVERCIIPAADYHRVNQHILRAVLKVESGLNPKAIGRNSNGTMDVGIGGKNSMHFKELSKYGINPDDLLDPCVGTYVAAWDIKKAISKFGNTWFGIATYHSVTPYYNERYQILIRNELIRSHILEGTIQPVPSLKSTGAPNGVAGTNSRTFSQLGSQSAQAPTARSVVLNE